MQVERIGKIQAAPAGGNRVLDHVVVLNCNRGQPKHTIESVAYLGALETKIAAQNPFALKHHTHRNEYVPIGKNLTSRGNVFASVVDKEPYEDICINGAGHSSFA
jgi:hypothetical protein